MRTAPLPSDVVTTPNLLTAARTLVDVPLAVYAIAHPGTAVVVAAFAVYWAGDVLDGLAARRLGRETRLGAVADIVADRACTATCAAALLVLRPDAWPAIAVFLVQFMVIDCLGVVGLILVAPAPGWATAFAVLVGVIKGVSLWTVAHLPTGRDH